MTVPKRIIKGKAYNTDTSTKVGSWTKEEEAVGISWGEDLYQNRFGQFFIYKWGEDGPDGPYEDIIPLTPRKARDWLVAHQSWRVDVIESLFGAVPEAGSKESKYTLRLPVHLHKRLAELAEANNQSLNAWMVKALEGATYMLRDDPKAGERTVRTYKFVMRSHQDRARPRLTAAKSAANEVERQSNAPTEQSPFGRQSPLDRPAPDLESKAPKPFPGVLPKPAVKAVKPFPGVPPKPKGKSS